MTDYRQVLARMHEILAPLTYLEIGVWRGATLELAAGLAAGVDPRPQLAPDFLPGRPLTRVYETTSDDFFAAQTLDSVFLDRPVELAFIDGLHTFAQVLRDVANVERWMSPRGAIVVHDVVPAEAAWASRRPTGGPWCGDVWRLVPALAEHRPDLTLDVVEAEPSGLLVVRNLDPGCRWPGTLLASLAEEAAAQPDGEYERELAAWLAGLRVRTADAFLRDLRWPASDTGSGTGGVVAPGPPSAADGARPAGQSAGSCLVGSRDAGPAAVLPGVAPASMAALAGAPSSLETVRERRVDGGRRLAVYTAIIGGYDAPQPVAEPDPGIDYLLFTDQPDLVAPEPWRVCPITRVMRDPQLEARRIKLLPHLFLPGHDVSVWIDAVQALKPLTVDAVEDLLREHDVALVGHWSRKCIYIEAEVVSRAELDAPGVVAEQVALYRALGFPKAHGLHATSFLARRHRSPECLRFDTVWWSMVSRHSKRDQLSFDFVRWLLQTPVRTLPGTLLDNAWYDANGRRHLTPRSAIDPSREIGSPLLALPDSVGGDVPAYRAEAEIWSPEFLAMLGIARECLARSGAETAGGLLHLPDDDRFWHSPPDPRLGDRREIFAKAIAGRRGVLVVGSGPGDADLLALDRPQVERVTVIPAGNEPLRPRFDALLAAARGRLEVIPSSILDDDARMAECCAGKDAVFVSGNLAPGAMATWLHAVTQRCPPGTVVVIDGLWRPAAGAVVDEMLKSGVIAQLRDLRIPSTGAYVLRAGDRDGERRVAAARGAASVDRADEPGLSVDPRTDGPAGGPGPGPAAASMDAVRATGPPCVQAELGARLSARELRLLDSAAEAAGTIIEFGAGGSTVRLLSSGARSIVSVESDPAWISAILDCPEASAAVADGRLVLHRVDLGPTGTGGAPVTANRRLDWPGYWTDVWNRVDPARVDLVFVDGRFRVACALNAVLRGRSDVRILVHDFVNREHYRVLDDHLRAVATAHTLALFVPREDVDPDRLASDLARHAFDPR